MSPSLVVQTSFLGDVVLTTPLLETLAARGPVTVVTTPAAGPLLEGHPAVARLVRYDKRGADRGLVGFLRTARLVAAPGRDAVAYLAQGSVRSGALARAAGYRDRIGFATSAGRWWYTTARTMPPGLHHAERLWRLAEPDGSPAAAPPRPSLHPSPEDREGAARLLERSGARGEALVALAPGSVWGTKRWPGFAELAGALDARGLRPVVVGGPDDRALAATIRATCAEAIDATGQLGLLGSAALLARCRALVTNDSLPLHLASAMDVPTVAVFGPTVPAFGFGPLARRSQVVEHPAMPCRPCHPHGPATCPLGHFRCMRDVTVGSVMAGLEGLLA